VPKVKLIRQRGSHSWGNKTFDAGKVYDVDDMTANYLVVQEKIAIEVTDDSTASEIYRPPSLKADDTKLQIALIRVGGIGDSLELAALATAVKREYPHSITSLYIRDQPGRDIIVNNPSVDRVIITGNIVWKDLVSKVLTKNYDIVYDSCYMTKAFYKNKTLYGERQKECDKAFEPYKEFRDNFPMKCNKMAKKFKGNNSNLALQTACLEGSHDDLFIHLTEADFKMVPLLGGDKYVTVHNGADIARQTKCWDINHWHKVAAHLIAEGYKIVQLGKPFESAIEGAIDMRDKTSLTEASALISKATFHIDTEGGLAHIARAVRTRSVILFGPTPMSFFGYKENVNIVTPIECVDCWWTSSHWWQECPKGYPLPPKCMQAITPEMVIDGIKKIEKMKRMAPRKVEEKKVDMTDGNEKFAIDLVLNEAHYRAEPWQLERVETMMSEVEGYNKVLEVGAGDGYCTKVLAKRGHDVIATEISQIRLERMRKDGIRCEYADVCNLPFPNDSFDAVIAGEIIEHMDDMWKAWKEIERVCKPNGKIVISIPIHPDHDSFPLHRWAIRHHEILRNGHKDMLVFAMKRINREK